MERNFLLKNKQLSKDLVSIYLYDKDPFVFIVGYIKNIFEDALLLEIIREDGEYDGYMIINLNSICQIEYDTNYLKKLAIKERKNINFNIGEIKDFILNDFFQYCLKTKIFIEVENNNLSIIGQIVDFEEDFLVMSKVNTDIFCRDGNIITNTNDITHISFMGKRQNKFQKIEI